MLRITDALLEVLNESGCKPNKIWGDKGSDFYSK